MKSSGSNSAEETLEARAEAVARKKMPVAGDTSAERRIIDQLLASEERLRIAQAAANIGTWDWDLVTDSATCSPEYFPLYGLPPRDSMPSLEDWLERVHPEDRARAEREVRATLENGVPYSTEYRVTWPDGSIHWLTSRAKLLRDRSGKPTRLIGAQVDITDRKLLEAELREHRAELSAQVDMRTSELRAVNEELSRSEGRLQELFDGIDDAILVHDETGKILECNEAACRRLEYSKSELLAMRTSDIDDPEFARGFGTRLSKQLQHGILHCEGVHLTKSGRRIPLDIMTSAIEFKGKRAVIAVTRDISELKRGEEERRQLERQMQHAQKLESLGVLSGGIAHDFNNLLMGILGNADLAMLDIATGMPGYEQLRGIQLTARRAADLCQQLLAYSGKGKFTIQPIRINETLQEMGDMLRVSISRKTVLSFQLDSRLPVLEGDITQIRQVVMNLITNGAEAIGSAVGSLVISTRIVDCDQARLAEFFGGKELEAGRYIELEVRDSGHGMDPKTAERIFEPFFTTKATGRGLGLSAVLGIVRGHHGAIKVESVLGSGTAFRLLFPASSAPVVDEAPRPPPQEWKGSGLILVVDDEEMIRKISEAMLRRIGFDVITAADGLEAIKMFGERANDISCVLMDLSMPKLSGQETLVRLRAMRPDVKVVLSSGYSELEVAEHVADSKLVSFIQKPYHFGNLQDKMREMLAP